MINPFIIKNIRDTLLISELSYNPTTYPLNVFDPSDKLHIKNLNYGTMINIFEELPKNPVYIIQATLTDHETVKHRYIRYNNLHSADPMPTNELNKFQQHLIIQFKYTNIKQDIWLYIRKDISPKFMISKGNIKLTPEMINNMLKDLGLQVNTQLLDTDVIGNGVMRIVNIPWNSITFEMFVNKYTHGLAQLHGSTPSYSERISNISFPFLAGKDHSVSFEHRYYKLSDTKVPAWTYNTIMMINFRELESSNNYYSLAGTNMIQIIIKRVKYIEFVKLYKLILKIVNIYVNEYNIVGSVFLDRYKPWILFLINKGLMQRHVLVDSSRSGSTPSSSSFQEAINIMSDEFTRLSKQAEDERKYIIPIYKYAHALRISQASTLISSTTLTNRQKLTKGTWRIKDESSTTANNWITGINNIFFNRELNPRMSRYKLIIDDEIPELRNYAAVLRSLFINIPKVRDWETELQSRYLTSKFEFNGGFDVDDIIEREDSREIIRMFIMYNTFEALTYSGNQSKWKNQIIAMGGNATIFTPSPRIPYIGIGVPGTISYYNTPLYNPFFIRYLEFIKKDLNAITVIAQIYKRKFTHGELTIARDVLLMEFNIPKTNYAMKTRLAPMTHGKLKGQSSAFLQYIIGKYTSKAKAAPFVQTPLGISTIQSVGKQLTNAYESSHKLNITKLVDEDALRLGSFYDVEFPQLSIVDTIHNCIVYWNNFQNMVKSNNEIYLGLGLQSDTSTFMSLYSNQFVNISEFGENEIPDMYKLRIYKIRLLSISRKAYMMDDGSRIINIDAVGINYKTPTIFEFHDIRDDILKDNELLIFIHTELNSNSNRTGNLKLLTSSNSDFLTKLQDKLTILNYDINVTDLFTNDSFVISLQKELKRRFDFLRDLNQKHLIEVQLFKDKLYRYYLSNILTKAMQVVHKYTLDRLNILRSTSLLSLTNKQIISIFEDILGMRFILIKDLGSSLITNNQGSSDWGYNLNLKPTSILLSTIDSTNPTYEYIIIKSEFIPPLLNGRMYRMSSNFKNLYTSNSYNRLIGRTIETGILGDMVFFRRISNANRYFKYVPIAQTLNSEYSSDLQIYILVQLSNNKNWRNDIKNGIYINQDYNKSLKFEFHNNVDLTNRLPIRNNLLIDDSTATSSTGDNTFLWVYSIFMIRGKNIRPIPRVKIVKNINWLLDIYMKSPATRSIANKWMFRSIKGFLINYTKEFFGSKYKDEIDNMYKFTANTATIDGAKLTFLDIRKFMFSVNGLYDMTNLKLQVVKMPSIYLTRRLHYLIVVNALYYAATTSEGKVNMLEQQLLEWFDNNVQLSTRMLNLTLAEGASTEYIVTLSQLSGLEQIHRTFKDFLIEDNTGEFKIPLIQPIIVSLIKSCMTIILNSRGGPSIPNILEGLYKGDDYRRWLNNEELTKGIINYLIHMMSTGPNVTLAKIRNGRVQPYGDLLQYANKVLIFDSHGYLLSPEVVVRDNVIQTFTLEVKNKVFTKLNEVVNNTANRIFNIIGNRLVLPNYKFSTYNSLKIFIDTNNCYIDYGIRQFTDLFETSLSNTMVNKVANVYGYNDDNPPSILGIITTRELLNVIE